ncbi:response regulator [Thiovibrio frasassiensis]|uniref:Response regulator n=1 Tax=Thiovibrio frasassiensis TaxID=2984131 RepID=A0A9X4MEF1_9BACT|nr:response regulator [Thiovibrio frasassiensis]MDG4474555.1 response regulator [Thiovibrio frasassiensis]
MDLLNDFAQKDMIEQIICLDEIKESRLVEAIPALLNMYANPLGDQAVDEMVYHTLFDLLAGREQEIIAGLAHESEAVRLLCIRRAADGGSYLLKDALVKLLGSATDSEVISEVIRALVNYKEGGLTEILLPYLKHEDYSVVAWAMRGLTGTHDPKVCDALMTLVSESREVQSVDVGCDLRTALAVENLASFPVETTSGFLIGFIHHGNPSFRRVVISTLAGMGEDILPDLEKCLETGDKDEKIMAANVIGMTGKKRGADILVAHLESAGDANLKFAIYEALGRISSMRSVIGLTDGLAEGDDLVLIAVMTALDHQCNPGVVKVLNETIARGDAQSGRVLSALITSHARQLFAALYKDGGQRGTLLSAVRKSGDHEAIGAFRAELAKIGGEQAAKDIQFLSLADVGAKEKRILAADDSKAMLFFYKGVAADLGMELVTVEDGKKAFDYLQIDSEFDLIITDMNMPNMDGIELTREIRKKAEWAAIPVLMATTESEKTQAELARQAGVTDFITKPFSKDDFKAKVGQMFA